MLYYKCDDGKCYLNVTDSIEEMASCDMDNKTLVGWWNPIFPSQDYWKYVFITNSCYQLLFIRLIFNESKILAK